MNMRFVSWKSDGFSRHDLVCHPEKDGWMRRGNAEEKANMSSRIRAFIFSTGSLLLLSGCTAASAGTAAVLAVPRMLNILGSSRTVEADSHGPAVNDDRRAWQRRVVDRTGAPLSPGAVADDAFVVWDVPVRIGRNVRAVAGLGRIECAYDSNVPVRWELLRAVEANQLVAAGEAWRAGYTISRGGVPSLAPLQAEALGMQMRANGGWRLTWLLLVPDAGDYILRVIWPASDVGLRGEPCIDAWGVVDFALAISATAPVSPEQGVSMSQPRTPFEAYARSRGTTGDGSPAASSGQQNLDRIDDEQLLSRFGLISVPAYDIVRLHQAALEYEMAPYYDRATLAALMTRRQNTLTEALETTPDALCRATRVHALDRRALRAWEGEPTVPPTIARKACSDHPERASSQASASGRLR